MSLPVDDPLAERLWSQEQSTHEPDQGADGGDAFHVLWATWHGLRNAWRALFGADGDADTLAPVVSADDCPPDLLPYAAAINGVRLPAGSSETTRRDLIRTRPAARRGTVPARVEGIQVYLSGTKWVQLDEQVSSAYTETISVRTHEIATSFADIETRAAEMKPAGIVLAVQSVDGWLIGELEAATDDYPTIGDLEAGFATIGDLEDHLP